jgi:hypothetical protein
VYVSVCVYKILLFTYFPHIYSRKPQCLWKFYSKPKEKYDIRRVNTQHDVFLFYFFFFFRKISHIIHTNTRITLYQLYIYSYTVCVPVRYITSYLKYTILHVGNIPKKKNKKWVQKKPSKYFFFFYIYYLYTFTFIRNITFRPDPVRKYRIYFIRVRLGFICIVVWGTQNTRLCELNVS